MIGYDLGPPTTLFAQEHKATKRIHIHWHAHTYKRWGGVSM